MKSHVKGLIKDYVKQYQSREDIVTTWKEPLVGFADANSKELNKLTESVVWNHQMPEEILERPQIIVSYFIPFTERIGQSNEQGEPGNPSYIWAKAYDETNQMMADMNQYLIGQIKEMGHRAAASAIAGIYSKEVLKSRWSQRHIARLAGLGTFGLNNMLITKMGCCGRYNSIVTDLPVESEEPLQEEYCLYKRNGGCKICVSRCTRGALKEEGFNRFLCHEVCAKRQYGNETCGKCVVHLPCTYKAPVIP